MSTIIIIVLTIINIMLVWALLSQARQYRKIIDAYNVLAPKGYRVDENGNLSEGDVFRYQGKRNGD